MSTLDEFPDVLSPQQTARLLGLGRTATYAAIRRGEIPAARIGGVWRVSKAKLMERFGLESRPPPGTEAGG